MPFPVRYFIRVICVIPSSFLFLKSVAIDIRTGSVRQDGTANPYRARGERIERLMPVLHSNLGE